MRPTKRRSFTAPLLVLTVLLGGLLPTTFTGAAVVPALRLLTEPSSGIKPIDALFSGAKRSIDLVVYELVDPHIEAILAAGAARGVAVRVLLDRDDEESHNAGAYAYLRAHHVSVRWASDPGIKLTHEKAAVIDGTTALVMTLNLVAADYASTRDFVVVDTTPRDVAAIDTAFAADWRGTAITPALGADLVWSPGAESALVSIINGARHSLLVENEEMADPYITRPLEAAARRGVRVDVVMTASSSWDSAFDALASAGVSVRTYAESAPLYIHAKAIVADAGQTNARAFVGSQNFSITSLVHNRELGVVTSSPGIVSDLESTINADFASARPWST
jgi:phosphatidylserine/phosphatidylglycerophosphate/cardiolipin synthase-like enzyme